MYRGRVMTIPEDFSDTVTRRTFLVTTGAAAAGTLLVGLAPKAGAATSLPLRLSPTRTARCAVVHGPSIVDGATWFEVAEPWEGLDYRFAPGALAGARFITADLLVEGNDLVVFQLRLQEGEGGPVFTLDYATIHDAEARLRMQTEAVNQNRWQFPREGAWLKPMANGAVVDLAKVDRMAIRVMRKSERPVRWCQTDVTVTAGDVERMATPRLPKGALVDELGQSRVREWHGKTRSEAELTARLKAQLADAPAARWPAAFSAWGGLAARTASPGRFFRTHHDGQRWWLLDPDGHPFWSAGLDSVNVDTAAAYEGLEAALAWMPPVDGPFKEIYGHRAERPKTINYLAANFIRAFGADWRERWNRITIGHLKRIGFNTIANWSDWKVASAARFPYVRPLDFGARQTPTVFRDLPDVFDPRFEADATRFAEQLAETRDDPAFIGYFLMNEPTWGFARQTPAAGMLLNTPHGASRKALRDHLARKYGTDEGLRTAWGGPATLDAVSDGTWTAGFTPAAEADLAEFSGVMVERFFGTLTTKCRAVDPNHLNLGIRYHTVPPPWAVQGMKTFDVFSMNCYESKVKAAEMGLIADMLEMPVMVGEWHFGALDVGLPGSGIGRVRTQEDRGKAYRVYLEDAAARPWCVGVHYFILYDQSALGRFDGECYNIGFLDVCNRPYEPLVAAARASHERMYDVATGAEAPYADAPEYLPKLFL
jgi:hypothetical protein